MTPEEIALMEAGALPSTEPIASEVRDISEELAELNVISEERFKEITTCLERLEQSSKTENPAIAAIQSQLLDLKIELVNLKSSMDSLQRSRTLNELPTPVVVVETPAAPSPVESTEEPKPVEQPTEAPMESQKPKRKSRFI